MARPCHQGSGIDASSAESESGAQRAAANLARSFFIPKAQLQGVLAPLAVDMSSRRA